jgi:cell division protein FtsW
MARAVSTPQVRARGWPWPARLQLAPSGAWTTDAVRITEIVGALLLVGLLMSLSASFVADAEKGAAFATFVRQLTFAGVGVVAFFAIASTAHQVWRSLSWLLVVVSIVTLTMVVIPGVGYSMYGATRWIAVGPLMLQPSELAKLATLLWLADVAARKRDLAAERLQVSPFDVRIPTRHLLVPTLPLLGVEALLVMLEPDLGTTLLLFVIGFFVLWFEGISLKLVLGLGAGALVFTTIAIQTAGYRMARITGWLDPEADPLESGFQLLQSLYALGSGGVTGAGLGASRGKWSFIPNPETDFIFAIIGEELGLIGSLLIVALFTALLIVGMRITRNAPDSFSRLVAGGITCWLVGQAFLNMSTVTGLLPITGVTLPLVSVGGSSLVMTLVAAGILVSIARAPRPAETPIRPRARGRQRVARAATRKDPAKAAPRTQGHARVPARSRTAVGVSKKPRSTVSAAAVRASAKARGAGGTK